MRWVFSVFLHIAFLFLDSEVGGSHRHLYQFVVALSKALNPHGFS